MQNEKTSERASISRPANCSSDMYAGVPTATPVWVSFCSTLEIRCGSVSSWSSEDVAPSLRASPKSTTFTRPSAPHSTLLGLKSRCTKPARWAAASPRPAAINVRRIVSHRSGPCCSRTQPRRVSPSTYSIAMKTRPRCTPTSWIATTLGCCSRASACASRSNRCIPRPARSACSTFTATLRSSFGS